jgi:hypothetical protein
MRYDFMRANGTVANALMSVALTRFAFSEGDPGDRITAISGVARRTFRRRAVLRDSRQYA